MGDMHYNKTISLYALRFFAFCGPIILMPIILMGDWLVPAPQTPDLASAHPRAMMDGQMQRQLSERERAILVQYMLASIELAFTSTVLI